MGLKPRHIEQNMTQIKKYISDMDTDKTGLTKREQVADINNDALFADGFDDAIIGYDANNFCAVYDYDKCMNVLQKRDKMSLQEAHEFMEFNVVCSFVGDFTPQFIHIV